MNIEECELTGGGRMWVRGEELVRVEQPGAFFEEAPGVWVACFWLGGFPFPMGTYATELEAVYACNLGYAFVDRKREHPAVAWLARWVSPEARERVEGEVPGRVEAALKDPQGRERVNEVSGYRGVTWDGVRGGWSAKLTHHGKTVVVGKFPTPHEAAYAYDACLGTLDPTCPVRNGVSESRIDPGRRMFLDLKAETAALRWERAGSKRGYRGGGR